jgi:hypothetical protein
MNRQSACRVLDEYRARVEQAQEQPWLSKDRRASVKALNGSLQIVNFYLGELLPDIAPITGIFLNDHVWALPRVRRALAILKTWGELASGEEELIPPFLPFAAMDGLVSSAAIPLWEAGKFRQAVSDAATRLNAFTQDRLGRRDIADSDLMAQAFSEKAPERGKSRLRCPGDHTSPTVRSMQHGAMLMAMGVFQAIRNPAAHVTGDWNPITAAEHLAALSTVARWVRHWEVVSYVPPRSDINGLSDPTVAGAMVKVLTQTAARPALPQWAE